MHRTVGVLVVVLLLVLAGCQSLPVDRIGSLVNAIEAEESAREEEGDTAEAQAATPEESTRVGVEIVQVAAGRSISFAVDADGGLWRWGANDSDLGLAPGHRDRRPTRVFADRKWAQVAVGSRHILLISDEGHLYSWGSNDHNVLGLGPDAEGNPYPGPEPHLIDDRATWVQVAAGEASSYALMSDGNLFAWGNPADGRLGIGPVSDGESVSWPRQVGGVWSMVSAGDRFAIALTGRGALYGFGANDEGQLGIGTQADEFSPTVILPDPDWATISAGAGYAFAVRNGELYAWGNNEYGQLGLGEASDPVLYARRVGTRSDWVAVSAGRGYAGPTGMSDYTPASAAVDADGALYLWGSNRTALLGTGEEGLGREVLAFPIRVQGDDGSGWREVSVGGEHAVGIRENDGISTWGSDRQSRSGGRPTGAVQVVPIGAIGLGE